jgi:aminomethyltransferase
LARRRVGVRLTAPGVARAGTELCEMPINSKGDIIGTLTSGGFSPTLNAAIGMAICAEPGITPGTFRYCVRVRGRDIPAVITPLPFVPAKTKLKKNKRVKGK